MREARRLLRLFRPYWNWMAAGVALSALTILSNIGLMAMSGWFITAMALAGASGSALNYFTPAALIRALAITRSGGRYLERLVTHEATLRLLARLRVWFFERLEPLAPAALQAERSGDLLSRARADVDTLNDFYLRLVVPVATAILVVATVVGVLSTISGVLAAVTLGWLVLAGVGVPWYLRQRAAPLGERLVNTTAQLRTGVVEHLQGMEELLVYGAAQRHAENLEALSVRQVATQVSLNRLNGFSLAIVTLAANLAALSSLLVLIPLVNAGSITPAELPAWTLLVVASFEAVAGLPMAIQQLGQVLPAAHRLFAIAERGPPVADPSMPRPWPKTTPGLEVRNLRFRYADRAAWALRNVSFELPPAGRLAVVGPSGSGKTTLVNLLVRFWDYSEGRILLGAHELREYSAEEIRRHMAVVSQHARLFTGSIRENLWLAAPGADAAALESACRTAQIHEFIAAQPQGYDTFVGEAGVQLSGGQMRRIAVAQALLKDAPFLLLDEPTEGLDPATEHELIAALELLMTDRSVLLITHRSTGLDNMDEILLLDHGEIVERGTHRDLMQRARRYRAFRHRRQEP